MSAAPDGGWLDDDSLTADEIRARMASEDWEPVRGITYPAARNFPGGLTCPACGRNLPDGTPYATQLDSLHGDGTPVVLVLCVYCADIPEDKP